jgi:hypothetical protein
MKSKNLSEGEELSKEACFKYLYVTFTPSLTENEVKREAFKSHMSQLLDSGIIYGLLLDDYTVILKFNRNKLSKNELYDLVSDVYTRYFSETISLYSFIKTICSLFNHHHKSVISVYDSIRKHKSKRMQNAI